MNNNPKILWRIFLIILIPVLLVVILTLVNTWLTGGQVSNNEFLPGWNAARSWIEEGNSPYSVETSRQAQLLVYQREARIRIGEDPLHFTQPVHAIYFYTIFGFLKFPIAMGLWMTISEILLVAAILILFEITGAKGALWYQAVIVGFLTASYFSIRAFSTGDIYPLILFMYTALYWAIKMGKERIAGIFLALTTIQPGVGILLNLFILIWSIRQKKNRLWITYLLALMVMIAIGTYLIPGWFIDWLKQLWAIPGILEWKSEALRTLVKLVPGIGDRVLIISTILIILYLLYNWARTDSTRFAEVLRCLNITWILSILLLPISSGVMQMLLFPAIIQVLQVFRTRFGRRGERISIGVVAFIAVGSWVLYLLTRHGIQESHAMLLPLPFLLLAGFWWSRWWMLSSPDRLIHDPADI